MTLPHRGWPTLLVTAVALAFPAAPSLAAGKPQKNADIQALQEQLRLLKENYEGRIAALEQRLARTETLALQADTKAADAGQAASQARSEVQSVAQNQQPPAALPPATEAAFNPAISLVLAGSYTRLSQDPNRYRIGGFVPSGGEVAPAPRSFGLGESELSIAANIDHLFRGQLTAAIAPQGGTVEVEESFIQTLGLDHGLTLKAGRFLSGIGYLNEQHAHVWDFADAPLAYKALFGNQLKNDGVQLKWLAPTDSVLLELGMEAADGGAFPSSNANKNGANLRAVYAHLGGDWGDSHTWRAGLSLVDASPKARSFSDVDSAGLAETYTFSGKSRSALADFVWKWAPNGNASRTSFKLQGEYLRRRENGDLSLSNAGASGAYDSHQSGWYLQGVYQFQPQWRAGVRFDRLNAGSVDFALPLPSILQAYDPKRLSVMVDWSPSEFSRVRLQWARDQARPDGTDNQLWLQYIMSLGAHGAHKY